MDLGSPALLALLALVPAAGVAWWWLWRSRRLHRIAVGAQVDGVRPGRMLSRALLLAVLTLIAVAAARPMWSAGEQQLGLSNFSLVVALDVSLSMAARDVGEQSGGPVSRFEAAQSEIRRLIDGRRGDRVGLIIFAGDAYLRFPLTRDHEAALAVLEALQPGEALVRPGSNIANALDLASSTIVRASLEDGAEQAHGAIAVVSDGETHDGDAVAAAATARELGLRVFAVGVGSERGATIPLAQTGALKTDSRSGEPVVSRTDVERLDEIAAAGGGRLIMLNSPGAMSSMNADLAAFDLARELVVEETALVEQFQWLAGAAALLLLASTATRVFGWSPRSSWTSGRRWGLGSLTALVGSLLVISGCTDVGIEQANREGVVHFEAGEYAEALDDWREAQRLSRRANGSSDPLLQLNAGRALHQLGEYERAETESLSALRSDSAAIRATAWFHVGNHRWANDDLLGARSAFIEALREAPALQDAKINLEMVDAILDSLQERRSDDPEQRADDDGQEGGSQRSATSQIPEGGEGDIDSDDEAGQDGASDLPASGSEAGLPGLGASAPPTAPTFGEDESLTERRERALEELRTALNELPLEDASLEQALAVLDALRAVPGERLAAGRLDLTERQLDW